MTGELKTFSTVVTKSAGKNFTIGWIRIGGKINEILA